MKNFNQTQNASYLSIFKPLLVLLILFFTSNLTSLNAQVTYDGNGASLLGSSLPFTVPAGTDRLLVISVCYETTPVTNVTLGTSSAVLAVEQSLLGSNQKTSLYYILLGSGASINSTITVTGGNNVLMGAGSFQNIDQANPLGNTAQTEGLNVTSTSLNISTTTGNLVVDGFCSAPEANPATANTSIFFINSSADAASSFEIATSGTTTMSYAFSSSSIYIYCAAEFNAAQELMITCPPNQTVECGMPTDPTATGVATASGGCGDLTVVDPPMDASNTTDVDCPTVEVITRTWTATDECGQEKTCDQIITIEDTTPPTFTGTIDPVDLYTEDDDADCPRSAYDECVAFFLLRVGDEFTSGDAFTIAGIAQNYPGSDLFSDNCTDMDDHKLILWGFGKSTNGCDTNIDLLWKIEDECGLVSEETLTQSFNIFDNTPPEFNKPENQFINLSTSIEQACEVSAASTSLEVDEDNPFTETDFTVLGNTFPAPMKVPNGGDPQGSGAYNDNCSENLSLYVIEINVQEPDMDDADAVTEGCPVAKLQIRWRVEDACGNPTEQNQAFVVVDDIVPDFDRPDDVTLTIMNDGAVCPDDAAVEGIAVGQAIEAGGEFTVGGVIVTAPDGFFDNCTMTTLSPTSIIEDHPGVDNDNLFIPPTDLPCSRTIRIGWQVQDECGNETIRQQFYIIQDDEAPNFDQPANETLTRDEDGIVCPADAVVEDIAEGDEVAAGATFQIGGADVNAPAAGTFGDNCTETTTLSVVEIELAYENDLDDDDDGDIQGTALPCRHVIRILWRVTDECENATDQEQFFILLDDENPEFADPADDFVDVTMSQFICPTISSAPTANQAVPYTSPTFTVNGKSFATPTGFSDACTDTDLFLWSVDDMAPGTNLPCIRVYRLSWRVYDQCGNWTPQEQDITVTIVEGPTVTVVPHITVDCFESINPNPAWANVVTTCDVDYDVTVAPVLVSNVGADDDDDDDDELGPNCAPRTYTYRYTATDECGLTGTAEQTYHIENDEPTMDCPDNCEVFGCYDGEAEAVIQAWLNTVTATSSCNDALTVTNDYDGIDGICTFENADGSSGFNYVEFSATDDCGREVTCESIIIIIDDDEPVITTQASDKLVACTANTAGELLSWVQNHGEAEATDECSGILDNPVSWSNDSGIEDLEDAQNALDCTMPQAIVVTFTVADECGNIATTTATFNTKLLPNVVNVAGLIQTEAAEAVASVEVAAYQSSGMTMMDVSDNTGDYGFEELPFEENTEIVPSRDNDYLNGVSTYDLILLQQHILGVNELNSPYKRIAADANRSGNISTLDLVLLRRLILLIDEELEDNTSWRFVDADFVFPNPQDPFESEFPEAYNLSGEEEDWASFVAVKIGDLNLDAETNSFNSDADDRSGLEDLIFQIEDQKLQADQEYEVEISSANFEAIRGFQMTLEYNHSLISVLDISGDALPEFSEANYNLAFAEQGSVPLSWNTDDSPAVNASTKLFSLLIKANADVQLSEVLSISSRPTRAEAYSETELMNVALNFTNNGTSVMADQFQLFQNQPNPFKDATTIGFVLPEDSEVLLEIFDVSGRLVHSQRGDYAKGYQQIDLDRVDLPSGILYYQVSTAEESASKKMIVLD